MRRYRVGLDPAAIADLDGIRAFVSEAAGKPISDRLIDRAPYYMDGHDTASRRGAARDDIRPGLRTVARRRTVTLIFVVDDAAGAVVVIGALCRGREVEAALRDRLGQTWPSAMTACSPASPVSRR